MTRTTLAVHTHDGTTLRLYRVRRYQSTGWSWEESVEIDEIPNYRLGAPETVTEYRTNGEGRGLWRYSPDGLPVQVSGTSQYVLPDYPATDEQAIRLWLERATIRHLPRQAQRAHARRIRKLARELAR